MKRERIIGIAVAVGNVILMIVCTVLYLGMDKAAPRFEFQAADMVYREDMDLSEFINGISAFDEEDGDITDRIVVEKLIENRAERSVIIFYAVSDKAGNVAKCSREFAAIFMEESKSGNAQEKMAGNEGEMQGSWLVQAGFWNDLEGDRGEGILEKGEPEEGERNVQPGEEESAEAEGEGNAGTGEERDVEAEGEGDIEPEEERDAEAEEEETTETEGTGQEEESAEREEGAEARADGEDGEAGTIGDSAAPVLTLQLSEVKTRVGVTPAWVEIIGTLTDDKDSYETLFRNLDVSKYDINQAGTYQVTVSTRDSDGNRSQAVPLTIIVR